MRFGSWKRFELQISLNDLINALNKFKKNYKISKCVEIKS